MQDRNRMRRGVALLAGACALAIAATAPASAKTFRYAFQGDAQSLDPHGLNETFTLGYLGNVYEGLTRYDENLNLVPGLAVSWEVVNPTLWRFKLREGVKFHDGSTFNADDVVFSLARTLTEGSDQKVRGGLVEVVTKIDDYTVEMSTPVPTPTLPRELVWIYIMDKEWSEANDATEAANPKDAGRETAFATVNANGTGPFTVAERQPDVKTVFKRFDGHWGDVKTNVTEVIFTPVSQDATRVAALLAGDLDLAYPIPVQDWDRINGAPGAEGAWPAPRPGPSSWAWISSGTSFSIPASRAKTPLKTSVYARPLRMRSIWTPSSRRSCAGPRLPRA